MDLDTVKIIAETTFTIQGRRHGTTVPKAVQEIMKLRNGDGLRWIVFDDDTILITKAKASSEAGWSKIGR